jgi:hypothetical protein
MIEFIIVRMLITALPLVLGFMITIDGGWKGRSVTRVAMQTACMGVVVSLAFLFMMFVMGGVLEKQPDYMFTYDIVAGLAFVASCAAWNHERGQPWKVIIFSYCLSFAAFGSFVAASPYLEVVLRHALDTMVLTFVSGPPIIRHPRSFSDIPNPGICILIFMIAVVGFLNSEMRFGKKRP